MRNLGPGFVVTAAFIGPGTITTATLAGAGFGFSLLWALAFSVLTTFVLQEMAARCGLARRQGLAEALRELLTIPWMRWLVLALAVAAIGIGNAAYQAGNVLGAAVGAATLTGLDQPLLVVAIALIASALLASGAYRAIESVLVILVFALSAVFIVVMLANPPDLGALLRGFVPTRLTDDATLTAIALIGTTVVPYNIFLYAATVQRKWAASNTLQANLSNARKDLAIAVSIGGLITLAIVSSSAAAFFGREIEVTGTSIAMQLEPVLGTWAKFFVAFGLLAAGVTSAITAPLAAAFVVCGALGKPLDMTSTLFRAVWLTVMACGVTFAVLETSPLAAILVAQAANALVLPIVAIALVWLMSQPVLGEFRNGWLSNTVGIGAILITLVLGGSRLIALLT